VGSRQIVDDDDSEDYSDDVAGEPDNGFGYRYYDIYHSDYDSQGPRPTFSSEESDGYYNAEYTEYEGEGS